MFKDRRGGTPVSLPGSNSGVPLLEAPGRARASSIPLGLAPTVGSFCQTTEIFPGFAC